VSKVVTFRRLGRWGRWANSVIEYAALRTYASRHGYQYECPPWPGTPIFGLTDPSITMQLPEQRERYVGGNKQNQPIPPEPGEFHNKDILGWCQWHTSWYAPDREFIQELYATIIDPMYSRVSSAVEKFLAMGECRIGLHFRRGDFGLGCFHITPVSWYQTWLDANFYRFHNPVLFIASEDPSINAQTFPNYSAVTAQDLGIKWCRDIPPYYNPLELDVATANPRGIDFFPDWWLLKHCDVVLTPNSTYSFTAAWLNSHLLECWRSQLSTGRFEHIDPWNCNMQNKETVDQFPHVPGTHLADNPHWQTHNIRPKFPPVPETP